MAFTALRVIVDGTATPLLALTAGRKRVVVRNLDDVRVYLGGATVTADAGFPIDPGETFRVSLVTADDPLYAITAGHAAEVAVLHV